MADEAKQPESVEPTQPQVDFKTFNLTAGETQALQIAKGQLDAVFSVFLSHIANARLAYPVSQRTQFVLDPQFKELKIGELPEDVPTATEAPRPGNAPDQPNEKPGESPVKQAN
jgi:hypothetical protein